MPTTIDQFLIDPIQKRLVPDSPHERLRQAAFQVLLAKNIPVAAIDSRVKVSAYQKRKRGTIDFVVEGLKEDSFAPLILVGCGDDYDQLVDIYTGIDDWLQVDYLFLYTSEQQQLLLWGGEYYDEVTVWPTYEQLLTAKGATAICERHDVYRTEHDRSDAAAIASALRKEEIFGEDTDEAWAPFVYSLYRCLMDETKLWKPGAMGRLQLVRDLGLRFTQSGNNAGGGWDGVSRTFVVRYAEQLYTLGLLFGAQTKHVNHPQFGNAKGNTILAISIDRRETTHNTLQLNIEQQCQLNGQRVSLFHNGKMAAGAAGGVSTSKVVAFVDEYAPHLVQDDVIYFGELNVGEKRANIRDVIGNLLEYGILRDWLRHQLKN